MNTERTFLSWRVLAFQVMVALFIAFTMLIVGWNVIKYNYPEYIASANDMPAWMVDGNYDEFRHEDLLALREGRCVHEPIRVIEMHDGTAVLTCGTPARLEKQLHVFAVQSFDSKVIFAKTAQ